jgi:hypothetical protein
LNWSLGRSSGFFVGLRSNENGTVLERQLLLRGLFTSALTHYARRPGFRLRQRQLRLSELTRHPSNRLHTTSALSRRRSRAAGPWQPGELPRAARALAGRGKTRERDSSDPTRQACNNVVSIHPWPSANGFGVKVLRGDGPQLRSHARMKMTKTNTAPRVSEFMA